MKKILFLLVVILSILSCSRDVDIINEIDTPDKGRFDPNALIVLNYDGGETRSMIHDMTALEIVKNAANMKFQSHYSNNEYRDVVYFQAGGFPESHRDTVNQVLKMWGTFIISDDGEYYRDFTYSHDFYITDPNNDTIAVVPDSVINKARVLIEAAYVDSNYVEVYRLFNEAFTFRPIE